MNTRRLTVIGIVAALCLGSLATLVGFTLLGHRIVRWTDGATISALDGSAPLRDILWKPAIAIEGAVNSSVDEYEPRLSPDGATMVFVRRRPGSNADLFASRWTPAGWQEPQPIESVNSDRDELGPEISADGTRLYFYSDRDGGLGGYDLWMAESVGDGWGPPIPLDANINTPYNEYGPALAPDGKRLYFASNRPRPDDVDAPAPRDAWNATLREQRARHDYDIYVAAVTGDVAQPATRLSELSTSSDEGSPALSPAGDFLYFASDRAGGLGGYDLYRSRLRDGIPQVVESLGDAINSSANELDPGLSAEGFRLFFSSDRPNPIVADLHGAKDYGLWWSASREVYREESVERVDIAQLWSAIWPWLLLLALLALLATLLALLIARHEAWRRRFARMSLLAQCLLVSILLHLLIASLLAAWKVGASVSELLRSGGTRVQLASSATHDDLSGSIAKQVRGELTTFEPSESALAADATLPTEILPPIPSPVLLTPANAMRVAAPDAPLPPTTPAPADAPLTTLSIASTTTMSPPRTPTAPVSSTQPEPARFESPIESTATLTTSAPSPLNSAMFAKPVELLPSPITREATDAAPSPAVLGARSIDSAPTMGVPNLATPAGSDVEASPTLPRIERATTSTSESMSTFVPTSLPAADAPSATPPTSLTSAQHPTITLLPSRRAIADVDSQTTAVAGRTHDESALQPIASGVLPEVPSDLGGSARLPTAPAAPVPVETFEQRDPSVRSELLERMGGNEDTERAVGLALAWLRSRQSRDGHWSSRDNEAEVDADAAMTGLALLCYLGAGHTHTDDGAYRSTVANALAWLVARQRSDGDLRQPHIATDPSMRRDIRADTMYGQTIATVALCEAYAMTKDPTLAGPARNAVDFVLTKAADARAGRASVDDTSVLGWLVMTIESARRAGFNPPDDVFASARAWLDTLAVSEGKGRFAHRRGGSASEAMTAEAMFVEQILGHAREEARMNESAEFIVSNPPRWTKDAPTHHWYYATLATFEHQGEAWERWNKALMPVLVSHQRTDGGFAGSWDPQDRWSRIAGRVHQTAICTLSLEVYYRYRPTAPASDSIKGSDQPSTTAGGGHE